MAGGDGFSVSPSTLATQAQALDASAAQLSRIAATAAAAKLDTKAYGTLCSFVPAMFAPIQQVEVEALDYLSEGVGVDAGTLRQAAQLYQDYDSRAATRYDRHRSPQ
jgi:hypothetical protein